ncbi:MAG: BlaI/MecI/CopY family transcriptional regulator [Streptosporangiales bacterium]|nr:BlaI/MecI/CopY family transcriptional regulator [Streptosporangiales bacterium]
MRSFGDLEAAIMDRIWSAERPLRVRVSREVLDQLQQDRQLAYTTVLTVTEILYRKGWLQREKDGRAYRYWPTATRAEYAAGLMDEALAEGDDPAATLLRFAERLDPDELDDLRRALRTAGRKRRAQ